MPGTHSKHVIVKNGMITDFKTYMTGELFDLLSTKSILAGSLEKENPAAEKINTLFENGVEQGASGNILHDIFHIRTNRLFNKLSPEENYYYLSGLLIGTELKDIPYNNYTEVALVSDEKFLPLYLKALDILKINKNVHCIAADDLIAQLYGYRRRFLQPVASLQQQGITGISRCFCRSPVIGLLLLQQPGF